MFGSNDPAYEEAEVNALKRKVKNIDLFVRNCRRSGKEIVTIEEIVEIMDGKEIIDERTPEEILEDYGKVITFPL